MEYAISIASSLRLIIEKFKQEDVPFLQSYLSKEENLAKFTTKQDPKDYNRIIINQLNGFTNIDLELLIQTLKGCQYTDLKTIWVSQFFECNDTS